MSEQTEHEKKVAQEIKNLYAQDITKDHEGALKDVRIQMIDRERSKKILLIRLPEDILAIVHEKYSKLSSKLKSLYPDFYILTIRNTAAGSVDKTEEKAVTKHMKANDHESWVRDLCYPALVEMRKTDVFNGSERIESALVSTNTDYAEDDFSAMEDAFKALTGRTIHYSPIFY